MANVHTWGGGVTSTYWSYYPGNIVYRDSIPWPTPNLAASGQRPLRLYSKAAASLSGGNPEIEYGGVRGDNTVFNVSGNFRFQCRNTSGSMGVGRCEPDGGLVVDGGDGDTRPGSIPGSLVWAGVPTAPRTVTIAAAGPGETKVSWVAPSNTGGDNITGYRVQRARDDDFTSSVTNVEVGNVLTYTDTTAVPGVRYYYRVFAKNSTATAASTTSVASSAVTIITKAGGVRFSGGEEVPIASLMRWNASSGVEVPVTTFVRWDAAAGEEVPISV